MKVLLAKLGATGDVVRTTPLISRLGGEIVWLTEVRNSVLIEKIGEGIGCVSWENRRAIPQGGYDLVINLEDSFQMAEFLQDVEAQTRFGAYIGADGALRYTESSREWFDLSLISSYGREQADRLKLLNRKSYQSLLFEGLGFRFEGEKYVLPEAIETGLEGDVAIAAEAGPVWPMKKWAYYGELKEQLQARGLTVNVLPKRCSLLEHLADVRNHRCLVSGDSLPMHLALGTGTRCVSLFTCTSPWEIYGYGIQEKIVSPLLEEFFYKRGFDERATMAIGLDKVVTAVLKQLNAIPGGGRVFAR